MKINNHTKNLQVMISNFNFAAITIAFAVLSMGCTNDPVSPNPSGTDLRSDSGWRVVWFWDKDKDETSDFSQYTFYFHDGGIFEATRNDITTTGTWRTATDDGLPRLVLFISNERPLSELNDDWVIVTSDTNQIRLKDDNDEHLEELHFEAL